MFLTDVGSYILYRWMVNEIPNDIRMNILNLILQLLQHNHNHNTTTTAPVTTAHKLPDHLRQKLLLKQPNLFPAVGELLRKQVSIPVRNLTANFISVPLRYLEIIARHAELSDIDLFIHAFL